MNKLINEKPLNEILLADDKKRKIIPVEGTRWGELIIPAKHENPGKTQDGLKVLAVASFDYGYVMFETLKECEKRFPERLNIVGLVTDDPANPEAKISMKRRIWRMFDDKGKLKEEKMMVESALSFGVPCYTGEIKIDYFNKLLAEWNPDAILVFVFGQFFNKEIINYPKLGIYNFHPADLANHYGAGPRPFEDMIERKAETSRLSIHHITEDVDAGHIVGQSPLVNIRFKNGELTENVMVLEDKLMQPVEKMSAILISELILRKEAGKTEKIDEIDFNKSFTEKEQEKLMDPIQSDKHKTQLPVLSKNPEFFIK
ncbi:MAG: hypothetical protein K8R53_12540 [Bacteroidales bacterium]|nr:hypothetical protein [Bacteroidales bacterium]